MKTIILTNIISLIPIVLVVRLSFPMWYEREVLATSAKTLGEAVLISLLVSLGLYFAFDSLPEMIQNAYVVVSIAEMISAAYIFIMLLTWLSKKIDRVFFLASIVSFEAIFFIPMPLLASLLEVKDLGTLLLVSFGVAAFLGSSSSVAVLKDIRRGDLMASLGTFIQILTLTNGLASILNRPTFIAGPLWLSFVLWVAVFATTNFYAMRYLRA